MGRFEGQVAIVVGGGHGVGLGVAMRMGREGASIVLVEADRVMGERAADMLDAEGIEGRLLLGDPADPSAAKWAATTAKLVWGRVDVVVYADPMGDVSGPLHAVGPEILDALYRNDVRGPLQYCQAVIPVDDGAWVRADRDGGEGDRDAGWAGPERAVGEPGGDDRSDEGGGDVGCGDGDSCKRGGGFRGGGG